jgi:hypothetical protein
MRIRFLGALPLLLGLALGNAGPALAVNVPGDYPTIQSALDAGATQILVADGTYHEALSVTHDVELLPQQPAAWNQPVPFPKVDGMTITVQSGMSKVYVRSIHFTGPVTQHNGVTGYGTVTTFESCWLDAGFSTQDNSGVGLHLVVRRCLVLGNLYAYIYYPDISDNVVVGGGITAHANGGGSVTGNLVIGPAAVGISAPSGDASSPIRKNTVRNVQDGIVTMKSWADSNLVEDCSGTAYRVVDSRYVSAAAFTYNVARRCSGYGIDLRNDVSGAVRGNVVDSTGLSGIHLGSGGIGYDIRGNTVSHTNGHGIWAEGPVAAGIAGNTVRFANGDGIHTNDRADSNVVGRCTGRGIVAPHSRHNTVYLTGDAGYELTGTAADSITHDIAYGNMGPGLRWSGTGTPFLGCNDWFLNSGGATSGIAPGATDLAVDPLFCNLPADLVTLSAISPLVSASGCGRIGALGMGCTSPVTAVPGGITAAEIGLSVRPLPASGGLLFSWSAEREDGWLQVYDVSGALRWSRAIEAGRRSLLWDGADATGTPLAPGTYFARRTAGGRTNVARVVIVR